MHYVRIVETYISPCEKNLVGRNVRAVLHSFGGRRHPGGGQGVVVVFVCCECFLAVSKSSLFISFHVGRGVNLNTDLVAYRHHPQGGQGCLGGAVLVGGPCPSRHPCPGGRDTRLFDLICEDIVM